jgi:dGTPase
MPDHQVREYAALPHLTRGRRVVEPEHPYRNCYERDRDRIVHSRAFRRLEYKTQVFPNHEGDHFRTRLTHTIEVAQLARTVAKALGLNRTLAEAIALTHDIGHPPFGHVGEEALDTLMSDLGGFEHNRHTLRTVDELEDRYAAFRGLNLTYEVREGIAKHNSRYDRFQHGEMAEFSPTESPPLEAQIIDLVDHIAYNVHDIDDGVEAHILSVAQLASEVPVFGRVHHRLRVDLSGASERALFNETIRRLVDRLATDLIENTKTNIGDAGIVTLADVRAHPVTLAAHSDLIERELAVLGEFLFEHLYRSPRVATEMERARAILAELFRAYDDNPQLLPARHRDRCEEVGKATAIADYVAGMTDRFVVREHDRLVRRGEGAAATTRYDA